MSRILELYLSNTMSQCYFLLSASAAIPIIYFVETVRRGKTYTTRSVKASQSGRLVFIMICSYQRPEPLQLSFQLPMPLNVPSPDSVPLEETKYDQLAADESIHPRLRKWYQVVAQVIIFYFIFRLYFMLMFPSHRIDEDPPLKAGLFPKDRTIRRAGLRCTG